jgi:tRNA 2-thiouridine synthesizing protein A
LTDGGAQTTRRKKMASQTQVVTHSAHVGETSEAALEGLEADATLDTRGLWCPLPPLKTMRALEAMKAGQVLEVLGTNPVGNRVSPWVAKKLGNQLLGVVEDEAGFLRLYYRKA